MSDDTVSWLAAYKGLGLEDAQALAAKQGRTVRVLAPDTIMTMDWRPDRLNLHVDDERRLLRISAG